MSEWIVLAVYALGFLGCYRIAFRVIDEHESRDSDEAADRLIFAVAAMFAAMFWPIVATGYAVWRVATPTTVNKKRREAQELEQRRNALRAEIRDMERRLGIGGDA